MKFLGKVRFELSDPPPGIAIQSLSSEAVGVDIVLRSDTALAKPGLKGNLLIMATADKGGKLNKKKGQSQKTQAALPAIPFEVVAP